MRYLLIASLFIFLFSCKNGGTETTGNPTEEKTTQAQPTPPAPAAPLPANMSVPDLRSEVRNVLRMQLPNTYAEMRNGVEVKKGYSFDVEPYAATGNPVWIVQEKLYDPETSELLEGGKYYCLWGTVDPKRMGYKYSEDGKKIALVIRAAERQSFVFHPYSQELEDKVVTEVVIGWYDRVQDATLARGLVGLQTLAANMDKWEDKRK